MTLNETIKMLEMIKETSYRPGGLPVSARFHISQCLEGLHETEKRERERTHGMLTDEQLEMYLDTLLETEKTFLRDRNPIEAIRSLRNRTGIGLKEAKLIIDIWRKQNDVAFHSAGASPL
jgi:ribosomal protein L7/L12